MKPTGSPVHCTSLIARPAAIAALTALTTCFATGVAQAQNIDKATIEQLLKRLEAAEAQIKDLKLSQPATTRTEPSPLAEKEAFPKLQFHGFGDITLRATDSKHGTTHSRWGRWICSCNRSFLKR